VKLRLRWPPFALLLCAGSMTAATGCPGTLADPERFAEPEVGMDSGIGASRVDAAGDGADIGCPDIPTAVFATSCASVTCHTSSNPQSGLDLQSAGVAARLVNVCATPDGTDASPGLLIDPANPSESVVYTKLGSSPPFGIEMPWNRPPLPAATIACVLQWVTAQSADAGAAVSCGGDAAVGDAAADAGAE